MAWCLGVALQLQQTALWPTPLYGAGLLLSCAVAWALRQGALGHRLSVLAWGVLWVCTAFAVTGLHAQSRSLAMSASLEGQDLDVVGVVQAMPQRQDLGWRFRFRIEQAWRVDAAGALQSVYPFWGRDLFGFSLKDVGLHFMAFALLSAIGQAGLTGPLSRRFGERRLAIGALVGVTVGLALFSVAGSPEIAWLAICVFGFANGLFLPAISSLMSFEAADDERGAVMGVFNASSSAGRIVGPALSGPIYFKFGPAAPFVLSAMLTVFGALLMARRKHR